MHRLPRLEIISVVLVLTSSACTEVPSNMDASLPDASSDAVERVEADTSATDAAMDVQSTDDAPRDVSAPIDTAADSASNVLLEDDFESYAFGATWTDGMPFGPWTAMYSGFGSNSIERDTTQVLGEAPMASTSLGETHASLVLSRAALGDLDLTVRLRTVRQLRTPAPNAWEVAWVIWHYTDEGHFYYFAAKPNGWELGKVDNTRADPSGPACVWPAYENCAYPGAQRYLDTGSSPAFPVGSWYSVRVRHVAASFEVSVDGTAITTFTDAERPYASGSVGLYNEDSHAQFDDVRAVVPTSL